MSALTPEQLQAPPVPPGLEAVGQDVQARANAIQRAQLNNSALASNPNAGPLNNTAPLSVVAVNQSALNNSALNARNAALNNSALNRSALSNQPQRQAPVNTSVHNLSAYNNNLANPIIRDSSPIGPLTGPVPQSSIPGYPSGVTVAQKEVSGKLTVIFWLGVLLVLVEMFIMLGRYHFLAILAGLAVIALFVLNLFSSTYNKFLMAVLFVSVGFDIAWLVIKMRSHSYPGFYSAFAELHVLLNSAVVLLVFLSIFIRVLTMLIVARSIWVVMRIQRGRTRQKLFHSGHGKRTGAKRCSIHANTWYGQHPYRLSRSVIHQCVVIVKPLKSVDRSTIQQAKPFYDFQVLKLLV